ncbi:MAG: patatin-like phospholipase family protein [Hyphomicrobiaceae bacterium]
MHDSLRRHLEPAPSKRILALDGGGVRGMVTLGLLEEIERILAGRTQDPGRFALADYFDLIAGTSTGAIIAAGLALGWKVATIREHYLRLCPDVFAMPQAFGLTRAMFDGRKLEQHLGRLIGGLTLESEALRTGFMIAAKRIDTGSPWVLTNNPASRFWRPKEGTHRPNAEYEIAMLIRASTAAPYYFDPVEIVINEGGRHPREVGLFVDGAMGGHNNPALMAFLVATLPAYGFGWATGPDRLLIVSVGTGSWRMRHAVGRFQRKLNVDKARHVLLGMIQDSSLNVVTALQAISEPRKPWPINSEVEDNGGRMVHAEPLIAFQRYDAVIDEATVGRVLGIDLRRKRRVSGLVETLRQLDNGNPQNLERLLALGRDAALPGAAGGAGVEAADFPAAFDASFAS